MFKTIGPDDPDCPHCSADPRYVEIVASTVLYKKHLEIVSFSCRCCGHGWTVEHPLPEQV